MRMAVTAICFTAPARFALARCINIVFTAPPMSTAFPSCCSSCKHDTSAMNIKQVSGLQMHSFNVSLANTYLYMNIKPGMYWARHLLQKMQRETCSQAAACGGTRISTRFPCMIAEAAAIATSAAFRASVCPRSAYKECYNNMHAYQELMVQSQCWAAAQARSSPHSWHKSIKLSHILSFVHCTLSM